MGQSTLFGKPKEEAKEIEKTDGIEDFSEAEEITDENGWGDYDHQEILNNKEEGHCYHYLQLLTKSDLSGISYSIGLSSEYEPPKGFMGSSYGSGGDFDLENPKKYFDKRMEHKLEEQKKPYKKLQKELWEVEYHSSSDFYRLAPMKNFIVIIGKKLKEMFKEKGFDFEPWYEKYRAIEENPATAEYDEGVSVAKELLLKGNNLTKQADVIKKSIKYKLGQRNNYGAMLKDYFEESSIDKLMAKLKEIQKEVFDTNKTLIDKYYKKMYHDNYTVFDAKRIIEVL